MWLRRTFTRSGEHSVGGSCHRCAVGKDSPVGTTNSTAVANSDIENGLCKTRILC